MWDSINIKSVRAFRSHPKHKARDRVEVVLEMPIEHYSEFRVQVEAPSALRNRRAEDKRAALHTDNVILPAGACVEARIRS
jgi:hypothetical protein